MRMNVCDRLDDTRSPGEGYGVGCFVVTLSLDAEAKEGQGDDRDNGLTTVEKSVVTPLSVGEREG